MKNKFISILVLVLALILPLSLISCKKDTKQKDLVKIRLNEVTRSVFYAPMYAAINKGFFKEEGLDIDLSTGQGADKTIQQVISGGAEIGFCGPEQVIYIYNQQRENYPIVFAQLTQKDGSFIVGRQPETNFKWESLKGKTLVGGRPGGMPEMSLEYVLRSKGLEPGKDVDVITNIAFAATTGAFKGGTGDYVALFEPNGSMLTKEKAGYIVESVGKSAGTIPYTCFIATKEYIDKNPDIIEKFTRAIYKGQKWVLSASDEEVAKAIISFFPGTDEDILVNVTKNYRSIDAFAPTPSIKEQDFIRLMDIIQSYKADLIPQRPPFNNIVTNKFADKIVKDLK